MLKLRIDNTYVEFGVPMRTNCAHLLTDNLLYSYKAEFVQKLNNDKRITEDKAFTLIFRYIE